MAKKQYPLIHPEVFYKAGKSNPKLLFIYDIFGSFSGFERVGSFYRQIYPFNIYSKSFEKVYITTFDNKKYDIFPQNVEHIPFNIPVIDILNESIRRFLYFFLSGFLTYKRVDYVEVIHNTAIGPAIIYKIMGAKIFLYHSWDFSKFVRELKGPFYAFFANIIQFFAFKIADTIAVATETLGEDVRKHTSPEKIFLLPNYVDTDLFKPRDTEKSKNSLVFVGRLHPQKNLPLLLQVMKQLPQFKLQIIGEGPLRNELVHFKNRNKIENVEFLGMIPHEELPVYLNKAEAFIFTTNIEGHPKALIEAMACELPCIGSNVEGIRDIIVDGETGVLCERNIEDIKKCILKLFEDRAKMKEIGRNARKFVVENYSIDKIIERRIKLIKGELDGIEPLFSGRDTTMPNK